MEHYIIKISTKKFNNSRLIGAGARDHHVA